jgi:hypothetical protein
MIYQFEPSGALITYGSTVPLHVTILNSTKYLLLVLAIISILYIYKSKNKKEFFCLILFIGILISGVIGTFIAFIPVDRLIGFYIPFAALFAALTLFRFHNDWFPGWSAKTKIFLIIVVSIMILLAGPLNFFAPALIFHDSPKDPYYWHSNDFSRFSTYGIPGNWINAYIAKTSTFFSSRDVKKDYNFMIPYFYGKFPEENVISNVDSAGSTEYFIVNSGFDKKAEINLFGKNIRLKNTIYSSGIFNIGNTI